MTPAPVELVCRTFLDVVPDGLVTGLYLRGGVGFGEWVPGQSDIDFVATLSHRPSADEVRLLRTTHPDMARLHPTIHFDGMHVLARDLARDPAECPDVPTVLGGYFEDEGRLDPLIAWHELAWHGVTVAGPPLAELGVWTDRDRLLAFTLDNLDSYWRGNAEALVAMPSEGAREEPCTWCVLGIARLHHLLVTGEMTTKSAAGRWGLTYYPERYHRVLREALRIRDGGPEEYVDDHRTRGRDTADFTACVVRMGTERAG
ncbi:MAG: DUF4111 domain-containing protein [Actinomycetota bacterium]|nr:DUF4111 domain-containing protein [Actinomycetota bacterium]